MWLNFMPQMGHEQSDRRPAVVVSPKSYNAKVGLALFCSISSQIKGYPFEVNLPIDKKVHGVILADQIKNLDYTARDMEFIFRLSNEKLAELLEKIQILFR